MSDIMDVWLHAHNMLRSARQIINNNLRPLGLSSAEGNILLHLLSQGKEMGQEQLVDQLDVSKPAISRTLNSLVTKGFVSIQQDPDDKRAHRIRLTGKALEIGPLVEQVYNRIYTVALRGITPEEFEYFVNLFSRMSENFVHEQEKS
ncbi:MAG: MarR family winged helix-turn-helix transcriptional regulator [Anaerolineales bacterium]|jgi:MarR family transcriptional regulator for hemolysin